MEITEKNTHFLMAIFFFAMGWLGAFHAFFNGGPALLFAVGLLHIPAGIYLRRFRGGASALVYLGLLLALVVLPGAIIHFWVNPSDKSRWWAPLFAWGFTLMSFSDHFFANQQTSDTPLEAAEGSKSGSS